ncbi:MAG: nitrate reductase associated protein [Chryseolinea sp.]
MTHPPAIEYFRFEEDFMEDNIRCIPMIVRFKLDAVGIKLKLKEWSKMSYDERALLAEHPADSHVDRLEYKTHLAKLIFKHTGSQPTLLTIDEDPAWSNTNDIPYEVNEKLHELELSLSLMQWQELSTLQRFVLLKLSRPGHENRNFPKAMKEFGLIPAIS